MNREKNQSPEKPKKITKKKRFFLTIGSILITMLTFSGHWYYNYQKDYQKRLFKKPQNLAQKIANHIIVKDGEKKDEWYYRNKKKIIISSTYFKKFEKGSDMFKISVKLLKNKDKHLIIDFYETNWNYNKVKDKTDLDWQNIEKGNLCFFKKKIYKDYRIDNKIDREEIYSKNYTRSDNILDSDCFTQRDIKKRKLGIIHQIFNKKKECIIIFRNGKKEIYNIEKKFPQKHYENILREIASHYNLY